MASVARPRTRATACDVRDTKTERCAAADARPAPFGEEESRRFDPLLVGVVVVCVLLCVCACFLLGLGV